MRGSHDDTNLPPGGKAAERLRELLQQHGIWGSDSGSLPAEDVGTEQAEPPAENSAGQESGEERKPG